MRMPLDRPVAHSALGMTAWACLTALSLGVSGCGQPVSPRRDPAPAATGVDRHEHDSEHGHDHAADGHDHGAGPHGGTLADWGGGKYHVEFTVDHDMKDAVVYVLGADEKTPAPVTLTDGNLLLTIREPAFQVELVARPQAGETAGTSSCYGGTHDNLGIVREFAGTISGAVDGTPFAGDFEEHAHEHK